MSRTRNCDLIEGMTYLSKCFMCDGEGEYDQLYNAGCGAGYFTMKGHCSYCDGHGIVRLDGQKVTASQLAQIQNRNKETQDGRAI